MNTPANFPSLTTHKYWKDAELLKRMQDIVGEIAEGKWFVSMEALFPNFDYLVINKSTGAQNILKRDDTSSFLTKHLKCYGGTGEYEDYKLGRFLRDITFSGKGLVRKPANPDSVILEDIQASLKKSTEARLSVKNLGYISISNVLTEKDIMADEKEVQKQIAELNSALQSERDKNAKLEVALKEIDVKAHQKEVEKLNTEIKSKDEKIASLETAAKEQKTKADELEVKLVESSKELTEAKQKLSEVVAAEKQNKRKLALTEAAKTLDIDVKEMLDTLAPISDEAFEKFISQASKIKVKEPKAAKEEAVAEEDANDSNAEADLEKAKAKEELALASGNTDKVKKVHKAIAAFLNDEELVEETK